MILDALKVPLILLQIKENLVCNLFTPLTVILYKRLKIEESVRQKMGAEQRGLNRAVRCRIFNKKMKCSGKHE